MIAFDLMKMLLPDDEKTKLGVKEFVIPGPSSRYGGWCCVQSENDCNCNSQRSTIMTKTQTPMPRVPVWPPGYALVGTFICRQSNKLPARYVPQGAGADAAVAAIRKLGGSVYFVHPTDGSILRIWLQNVLGDDLVASCYSVDLANTQITNAGVRHLRQLPDLWTVGLDNTAITDDGLKHLAGLSELRVLSLDNTNVTGAGLKDLSAVTKLDCLNLSHTKVTDAASSICSTSPTCGS